MATTQPELQDAHNIVAGSPETVINKLRYGKRDLHPGDILIYGYEGNMALKDD